MTGPNPTEHDLPRVNHLRSLAAGALGLVPAAVVAWSAHAWSDRLPDPLPTHWRELSRPDGFSSYAATWQLLLVVALAGTALGLVAAAFSWVRPLFERATAAVGAGLGFGALGIWLATAHAAWDRSDAVGAPLGWGVALPVVGLVGGAVAAVLMVGRRPRTLHVVRAGAASSSGLVLAPGERAVWAHRTFLVWPLALAALLAVVALVLWFTSGAAVALLVAATAVGAALLAWVQVTVDARGLRIGLGPWAWAVKKVELTAIARASAEPIQASDWGGWGYRVMPGRSALVLRSGPAIVLDLTDGRRFAVTVDAPDAPVALLDALRARADAS